MNAVNESMHECKTEWSKKWKWMNERMNEMKWNEMSSWKEMEWNEMNWNAMKWNELKCNEKWKLNVEIRSLLQPVEQNQQLRATLFTHCPAQLYSFARFIQWGLPWIGSVSDKKRSSIVSLTAYRLGTYLAKLVKGTYLAISVGKALQCLRC